jgi:hypothetical protein
LVTPAPYGGARRSGRLPATYTRAWPERLEATTGSQSSLAASAVTGVMCLPASTEGKRARATNLRPDRGAIHH